MDNIAALLGALEALNQHAEDHPRDHFRWTPPQHAFLQSRAPRLLFRSGNQQGKTTAGIEKKLRHARKTNRPGETWIVCTSWAQSVSIMRKFHSLIPPDWVDHRQSSNYTDRSGYGKDNPAVITTWGWVFRFRTTNQGPEALQGATIDDVLIDEPTAMGIYRELDRRVMRRAGRIDIVATPANRDCTWLREMVEEGAIEEVHARLTVENLTPVGASEPLRLLDGTPMDQAWIDEQRRITPAMYAPIVLDGEWDMAPQGVWFDAFSRDLHVSRLAQLNPQRGPVRRVLGIDYSAANRDYGQCAALVQVQEQTDEHGRKVEAVLIEDEVVMSGVATNTQFADSVLDMLERRGLRWHELYRATGDNPVRSRFGLKSNIETARSVAKRLGVSSRALRPRILNAKDDVASAGTVTVGCRYLHVAQVHRRFIIHPRCSMTIEAFETWDFDPKHPAKDRIDAIRYALKPWIFPFGTAKGPILRVS